MGIPQVGCQMFSLKPHTVTHPSDIEFFAESLGDAGDHVVDQSPGEAVQGPVQPAVCGAGDTNFSIFNFNLHIGMKNPLELTFRTFHSKSPTLGCTIHS